MKKWLIRIGALLAVAFALIQGYRPERTNPLIDPARTIQATMSVPPHVNAILERSCNDCHTHDTHWPWYSEIAPVSWLLVDDVNEGREHLNFSEWASYDPDDAKHKIEELCEEVQEGEMPLKAYLLTHPRAKLSESDRRALCAWSG